MTKWIYGEHGIRYREHPTKTIGVGKYKRPLRYFACTYKWKGKVVADIFGWEGIDFKNEAEVMAVVLKLRQNRRDRIPPFTRKELLAQRAAAEKEEKAVEEQKEKETLTFLITERLAIMKGHCTPAYYKDNDEVFVKFNAYLKNPAVRVSEINRECIEKFLERQYRTPGAYNYAFTILRALFNHGVNRSWFDKNPARGIKKLGTDKFKKYIPPKKDLDAVINLAKGVDKIFFITLKNTLARVGEIYALTWDDISFENSTITLWTRKKRGGARTPRTFEMTEELRQALSTLEKKGKYVFVNEETGERFEDKKKVLMGLCKRAGVERFTFHSFRHYGASLLAKNNVALSDIQEILGHESVTTTAIYIQSLIGSKNKAIHLLNIT